MKPLRLSACLVVVTRAALAQSALIEPPEFPMVLPGPQAVSMGDGCFLLAEGVIFPGDVDWIRVQIPRASARTVIDVDFPDGQGGSALLAMTSSGTAGFNIADNNNSRDALCGLSATSSPVGSLRDSVVDLHETIVNTVIDIAITGAADTSFVGFHTENFAYEVWVYTEPFPCVNDADCDDGVACTMDTCDVGTGDCSNEPQDAFCDNGVFCDGAEQCVMGLGCQGGTPPSCNDNVACTDDSCNFSTDQCINQVRNSRCDNGIFCDGEEICEPGVGCVAGEAVDCDDGVGCTVDACDEQMQDCVHAASDDACDDGQFCNGMEYCDVEDGCRTGSPPCPESACRESDDRCVECLSDSDCTDGQYCNGSEHCNSLGICIDGAYPCGQAMCRESDDRCVDCMTDSDCSDGEFCNGDESCNPGGQCESGELPCVAGLCRESDDRCVECLSESDCDDGVFCNGAEGCNAAGMCTNGTFPCDGLTCREVDDRCVDCLADTDCDDGAFCNGLEHCNFDGTCSTGAIPCEQDFCNEENDRCVECLADEDCADDLFCNGVEHCQASGVCAPGESPCSVGQSCNESADTCSRQGFSMKIKPGACPARVMTTARGNLHIAIIGTDVKRINRNSIRLTRLDGVGNPVSSDNGPNGQGPHLRDVSGPTEPCTCQPDGPDGLDDLIVSFTIEKLVKSLRLEKVRAGSSVQLRISGKLRNGMPFSATDCLIVQSTPRNAAGAVP